MNEDRLQIIVTFYEKDTSWLSNLNCKNILIYNKGPYEKEGSIRIEKIGLADYTAYYHIVNNYDKLSDFTAFVQDYPFDHCPDIINQINSFNNKEKYLANLFLTEKKESTYIKYNTSVDDIKAFYTRFFEKKCELDSFFFPCGAHWIVSRERIQRRPKEFYERILKMIEAEGETHNQFMHMLERMWPHVLQFEF